uniref:Ribosomal protein S16 n=1 Tax=Fagus sylvatica TaxID=28930 RepID=A0A2N9EY66_FAGSY
MVVKIRLARFGCKHRPFYRVMTADSKSPRDGKHVEVLGFYDPLAGKDGDKRMGFNYERLKYWLSVGAQPSETVQRILSRAGLLPPPPMGHKGGPRDTRPVDPFTGSILTLEKPVNDDHAKDSEGGEVYPGDQESLLLLGFPPEQQSGLA